MVALPAEIKYGTVTAQLFTAVIDSTSDGDQNPEGIPVVGKATFKPAASALKDAAGSAIILPQPMTFPFNAAGQLVSPDGTIGARLISSDSPSIQPLNFSYNVSFDLIGTTLAGFNFYLPSDTTLDLSSVLQVPSDAGTIYIKGDPGDPGAPGERAGPDVDYNPAGAAVLLPDPAFYSGANVYLNSASCALSFTDPSDGLPATLIVDMIQDAVGGRGYSIPAGAHTEGNLSLIPTPTANATDRLWCVYKRGFWTVTPQYNV